MTARRLLDATGAAMVVIAAWSIAGAIVSLWLDNPQSAWRFLWAVIGSGVTLIAISIYEERAGV